MVRGGGGGEGLVSLLQFIKIQLQSDTVNPDRINPDIRMPALLENKRVLHVL